MAAVQSIDAILRAMNAKGGTGSGFTGTIRLGGGSGGLAGQYQSAYDEAKRANESRYQQGLDLLQQEPTQMRADVEQAWRQKGSQLAQGLVSRGLGNSTLMDTMQMGVQSAMLADQARIDEAMLDRTLNWIQARTDSYPDFNQLANLSSGAAARTNLDFGGTGGGGPSRMTGGGSNLGGASRNSRDRALDGASMLTPEQRAQNDAAAKKLQEDMLKRQEDLWQQMLTRI